MKKNKTKKKVELNVFTMQIIYLFVVIVFAVIFSVIMPSSIYIDLLVVFFTAGLSIYVCFKEIKSRKYRVRDIAKGVDLALKDNFNTVKIPMAMVLNSVDIVWKNTICTTDIPDETIIDVAIDIEKKNNLKEELKTSISFAGKSYNIVGSHVTFTDYSCLLLSFIDISKEHELVNLLDDTKTTVGMIFIDNYDETLQGLDDMIRLDVVSKIDKEIRKWVKEVNGAIAKTDKDRYMIFIEKKYIADMEKTSFDILENIRNITNVTKLPITISIGMSYADLSLNDRHSESSSALDIALGRGGDQVVIKNGKKFDFYGGNNIGLEKTSRVRARTIAQALKDIMEKVDNIYIIGHKNTDIDCIGAAVGVYKIAESLGKNANIIVDAKYNNSTKLVVDRLKNQKEYEEVFYTKDDIKKIDYDNSLLIVVDTHKKTFLAVNDLIDNFEKIVVIDHHRRGPEFIDNALLTYHEIYSSSTSELVTELLMYLENIKLTSYEAEAIYAGILVDTKNFTFKTGVKTFEVAAYLRRSGMDITEVKQIFQNDFETYVAKVDIVKNAEIIEGKIAISTSDEIHDDMPIIAAQAADELLTITGISASFVLCKVDNVIMISGRSMGDINVQSILETVGGGGHLTFAGAQIAGISIEEAKEKLVQSIHSYLTKLKEKE